MLNLSHVNSFLFESLNSFPEFIEKTFHHIYTHEPSHHIVYTKYLTTLRDFIEETYENITDLQEKKDFLLELIIARKVVAKREKQLVNIGGPYHTMYLPVLGAITYFANRRYAEKCIQISRKIISHKMFNAYVNLSEICHATNGTAHMGRLCLDQMHPPWGAAGLFYCYDCRWLSTLEHTGGLCALENMIFSIMSNNWHWRYEYMDWIEASHFYLIFMLENTSLIALAKKYLPRVPKTAISTKLADLKPDMHFLRDICQERDNTVIEPEVLDFLYDFRTCYPHLYTPLSELEIDSAQTIWQLFNCKI